VNALNVEKAKNYEMRTVHLNFYMLSTQMSLRLFGQNDAPNVVKSVTYYSYSST
jgi:hypothetical protein